jgi:hypothetical protein
MVWILRTHRIDEKYIQVSVRKSKGKKPRHRRKDNINVNFKENV